MHSSKNNKRQAPSPPSPSSPSAAGQFKFVVQSSQSSSPSQRSQCLVNRAKPKKRFYNSRSWWRKCLKYTCPPCLCCCCPATSRRSRYKHEFRHPKSSRSRGSGRSGFNAICLPFCCSSSRNGSAVDSSEDICDLIRHCGTSSANNGQDIDQYVARYRSSLCDQDHGQLPSKSGAQQQFAMTTKNATAGPSSSSTVSTPEVHKRSKKRLKKHFWNWNDSLKSNSDKFLESLEYDAIHGGGGGGSKSNSLKKYRKIPNCSDIEGISTDSPVAWLETQKKR